LLENKIDAGFQPDQAERYHRRGEEGIQQGTWAEFITCIVAPQVFLNNQSGVEEFDTSISYERLVEWFDQQKEQVERSRYRGAVLRYAAEKTRRKAIGKAVPEITAFWAGYWQLACREFPELRMPQPGGKGPLADWPDFRGNGLPAGTHILHKWADGKVDLELSGMAAFEEEVRRSLTESLPDGVSIEVTGKSLALRLMVPPLDRWQLFDKQLNFVQHVMTVLKTGGRGAMVLPDNCLFEGKAGEVFEILMQDCNLHTILRLPRGTFTPYSQGVKANVIFFQKGRPTEDVWIFDGRSNVPGITKKDRPLAPEHFSEFERSYGADANDTSKRKESERFRRFSLNDAKARDYKLDVTWLKDDSLEDADELPEPQDLATEAITELEAALDDLREIVALVEKEEGVEK
jgi:hypothetical protein